MTPSEILQQPFTLPCGVNIPNRIVKSAMSENNADKGHKPSPRLIRLYDTWGGSGAGVLVSGNVMIDRNSLGEVHNVVVEDERHIQELKAWSDAAQKDGSHLWMQINHPGRQAPSWNKDVVSASDVPLSIKGIFKKPRALTEDEILDLIDRYGNTALVAKKAGWKGVQIHGAHGYLVSQFLSPLTNIRTDQWGGPLENRARFVLEVYRDVRKKCGDDYPIGIKLNSADFQRGAFTEEESMTVIAMLGEEGMDMIEVSGGTYEQAAMMGRMPKDSTREREAYFIDFIKKVRNRTKAPLLLTGGFRTLEVMAKVIENDELDFVGLARPFAVYPHVAHDLFNGTRTSVEVQNEIRTGFGPIDKLGLLNVAWYADQMKRMGNGKEPKPNLSPWGVFFRAMKDFRAPK